ncbi:MAG: hypothetical protein ACLFTR_00130 [Candidatus Woesearchaeota archaeon]
MKAQDLVVGVDIDNTLILEIHHYVSHIKDKINPDFSYSGWRRWDLLKLFPDHKKTLISFMRRYYSRDNISNLHVMDGAHDFLSKFDKENLFYVTARSDWLFENPKDETYELLHSKELPVTSENVILQKDAQSKIKKCKSLIAREKGMNFFIEDNPDNAVKISEYCPVLLIDYPFNRNISSENIYRIGRFDDASGNWSSDPWREALELLDSGELLKITSDFFWKEV